MALPGNSASGPAGAAAATLYSRLEDGHAKDLQSSFSSSSQSPLRNRTSMSGLLDEMNAKGLPAWRGKKAIVPLVALTALLGLLVWGAKEHPAATSIKQKVSSAISWTPRVDTLKQFVTRNEELFHRHLHKRQEYIAQQGGLDAIKMFHAPGYVHGVQRFTVWDIYLPSWNCPWETERIGRMADGGKLTCGLERIQQTRGKKCVAYSFGVEQESSWEAEILQRTDCEIYMFDFSVNEFGPQLREMDKNISKRAHFYKWGIGGEDKIIDGNQFYTLETIMAMMGHDWIDILKVDTEGAEYQIFPDIIKHYGNGNLPFGQLLLEIHTYGLNPRNDFKQFDAWWRQLEDAGLRAYSNELNYPAFAWLEAPMAMEMNFINNCNGAANCGTVVRHADGERFDSSAGSVNIKRERF